VADVITTEPEPDGTGPNGTGPDGTGPNAAGPGGTEALATDLLAALGMVRRHVRRVAGRPWPLSPLTGAQSELLRLVRLIPGISVAEAANELGLAPNTVSTLVGQLTELGLLSRSPDPRDRRVARLTLTAPAQRQVEAWRDRRAALVTQVLDRLHPADLDALRAALPALGAIAEQLRPDRGEHDIVDGSQAVGGAEIVERT
jgi:DNA-binding MarR family transcriptional regulator